MNKTTKLGFMLSTACAFALIGVACNTTENSGSSEVNASVNLVLEQVVIDVNETMALVVETENVEGALTWVSSNPEVVAVDEDGKVIGYDDGEAVITVSYFNHTDTCTVTVDSKGKTPTVSFGEVSDTLELLTGQTFQLEPALLYNANNLAGASFTYQVTGDAVTVSETGLLTAVKKGEATVSVSGAWHNESAAASFSVDVLRNLMINASASKIELATSGVNGAATSEALTATVSIDGKVVENPALTYTLEDGESVISVENGVVKAALTKENIAKFVDGAYTTKVTLSYAVEGEGTLSAEVEVAVSIPQIDKTATAIEVTSGAVIGGADLGLASGTMVIQAVDADDAEAVTVENGGLKYGAKVWGERTLSVYTADGYAVKASVVVITKIITTHTDFVDIFLTTETTGKKISATASEDMNYSGYYVLGNDIVFPLNGQGKTINYLNKYRAYHYGSGKSIPEGYGFNGVFDGRGYTVSGLAITNGGIADESTGIFSSIGKNGVVKNVSFVNGIMRGYTGTCLASYLAFHIGGTVQDVFIHIDMDQSSMYYSSAAENERITIFGYGLDSAAKMINVIGYVSGTQSTNGVARVGTRGMLTSGHTVTGTYLVTNDALAAIGTSPTVCYNESAVKAGASFDTSTYNTAVWNLTEYKMPVFKSMLQYLNMDAFKNS